MSNIHPLHYALLVLAIALLARPVSLVARAAGDATPPTAVVLPETPAPAISPETLPTAAPFPTVRGEVSTPVITSVAPPTITPPAPAPTSTVPVLFETPTQPSPMAPPQPVAPLPVTAPPSGALPSPADLRKDAELRWGKHVPSAVRRWAFLIVPAARAYHLDPNLIAAVMTMESGGDPLAWNSGSDARGLMQILHGPWDPKQNIYLGAKMLRGFLDEFGDLTLALAAYNAGPNAVISYKGVPPYRETQDYVVIVRYLFDVYRHHSLSTRRKAQFHHTLIDLGHFADQRKKVAKLAKIAHIPAASIPGCNEVSCAETAVNSPPAAPFQTGDPFWPMGGPPDPLPHVGPQAGTP